MRLALLFVLTLGSALGLSTPALAAVVTTRLSGPATGGGTFTATLVYDTSSAPIYPGNFPYSFSLQIGSTTYPMDPGSTLFLANDQWYGDAMVSNGTGCTGCAGFALIDPTSQALSTDSTLPLSVSPLFAGGPEDWVAVVGQGIVGYVTSIASTAVPSSASECKKGGWAAFGIFKNQGDCVSFAATGGKNPPS